MHIAVNIRNPFHPRSAIDIHAILAERYPKLFGSPVPLAIGIHLDLGADCSDLTAREIEGFLHWWCNSKGYLESLVRSVARRHGLDGKPGDCVSDADRMVAAALLQVRATEAVVEAIEWQTRVLREIEARHAARKD